MINKKNQSSKTRTHVLSKGYMPRTVHPVRERTWLRSRSKQLISST